MNQGKKLATEFVAGAAATMRQNMGQIRRCAALLSDDQAWHRSNGHCNSVANLILHLTGNVRQWIVAGLGGDAFARDRPREFAEQGPRPIGSIVDQLEQTTTRAISVAGALDATRLLQEFDIQGYRVTGLYAVFHVAEHFSFHTGQIIHITKALLDVDLSLYDEQGRRVGNATGGQPWGE